MGRHGKFQNIPIQKKILTRLSGIIGHNMSFELLTNLIFNNNITVQNVIVDEIGTKCDVIIIS